MMIFESPFFWLGVFVPPAAYLVGSGFIRLVRRRRRRRRPLIDWRYMQCRDTDRRR